MLAIRVNAGCPGGAEPGGVVGVLGEAGTPGIVGEGVVPFLAQSVHLVECRGTGGASAGR